MIRRVTEYVIVCDADRLGSPCMEVGGTAFGSLTMTAAIEDATEHHWKQISKRFWLCPRCAERLLAKDATASTSAGGG